MSAKRTAEPSPESVARANRQRLAQEEGVRALADLEKQSAEIRKNMQRLRTLREAKLAEEIDRTSPPPPGKKKRKKQIVR